MTNPDTDDRRSLEDVITYAKGRPWITGREPGDREHSCVRLSQQDLVVLGEALAAYRKESHEAFAARVIRMVAEWYPGYADADCERSEAAVDPTTKHAWLTSASAWGAASHKLIEVAKSKLLENPEALQDLKREANTGEPAK